MSLVKDDESGRLDADEMKVNGTGTSLPATVVAELAKIGPIWKENIPAHAARMVELFSPLLARCPKGGVRVSRAVSYGPHARNLLDVFHPLQAQGAAAVLFVAGGGFVDGERNRSDEIYANVLYYFARHGIVGISRAQPNLAAASRSQQDRTANEAVGPRWPDAREPRACSRRTRPEQKLDVRDRAARVRLHEGHEAARDVGGRAGACNVGAREITSEPIKARRRYKGPWLKALMLQAGRAMVLQIAPDAAQRHHHF